MKMGSKKYLGNNMSQLRKGLIVFSFLMALIVLFYFPSVLDENYALNFKSTDSRNVVFIFGLGGSGTRGVTKLLESWGCKINFFKLNAALDNTLAFQLNTFVDDILNITRSVNYDASSLPPHLLQQIDERMKGIKEVVNRITESSCAVVKWPRLIYLVPVLKLHFPNSKFILVVRDGRDMVFSKNKIQYREFNRFYLTPSELKLSKASTQLIFWHRLCMQSKTWLEKKAPDDSVVLRIESLVLEGDEAVYNKLYQTSLSLPPPANLSLNEIFETPIANRRYNTSKYGKYKYLKRQRDIIVLQEIEKNYSHELEELGYTVNSTKYDQQSKSGTPDKF